MEKGRLVGILFFDTQKKRIISHKITIQNAFYNAHKSLHNTKLLRKNQQAFKSCTEQHTTKNTTYFTELKRANDFFSE